MKYVVIVKMISDCQVNTLQVSCLLPPCRVDTLRLVLETARSCNGPFMRRPVHATE